MKPNPPAPDDVSELRSALLTYYDREARDLPWRRDRDPYRVLVSEVMLQQTRVETVLGYYDRWLRRFPTVYVLASASEDEVMKSWEGLGYYRRARNLHAAAKAVRERSGRFPQRAADLRSLPGVGEYTAGAVASIAFDEVTPAVDGNVRRVLSRLHDEPDPKPAWLRKRAADLVDPQRPGDWNQALMELGATVCTPRSPRCVSCPVSRWCVAHASGTAEQRPLPRAPKEVPRGRFVVAVAEHDGRVLVQRRPASGLLGGLWAFPERRVDEGVGDDGLPATEGAWLEGGGPLAKVVSETARELASELGLRVNGDPVPLEPVPHRFAHLEATYLPVILPVGIQGGRAKGEVAPASGDPPTRWIGPDDSETALPVAQRKVLESWHDARTKEAV